MNKNNYSGETTELLTQKLDLIAERLERIEKQTPKSSKWVDTDETCAYLKVSKRTLQNYRDEGILAFSQFGGKILYKTADLDAHLEKYYVKAFR